MNILVAAPYGMYQDFTSSFIHNQAKELRFLRIRPQFTLGCCFDKYTIFLRFLQSMGGLIYAKL